MAFARNHAERRLGLLLRWPSILRVASTGESTTRRRIRAGSQSTNKLAGSENQDWQQRRKLTESGRVSPTVLQSGPYRFFFFSSDRNEPIHVHVKRDRKLAKFWLAPVRMAYNYGFSETELNRIAGLVRKHEADLSKAWHDYFKRGTGNDGSQERSGH